MGTVEKGTEYEIFVHKVYQAILRAELLGTVKNIRVEHDVKLEDRFGQSRQIDVYWEYSLGGIIHKVGVECRNYNSSIPVEKIDAFATKVQDLRLSKGIMVSVKGFQSGAVSKAEHHGISLIEMREITDEDFEGYLQIINIQIHALLPPRIVEFKPEVNRAWIEKNYSDHPKGGQVTLLMSGRNAFFSPMRNPPALLGDQ